jgi:hypothetical protein
MKTMLEVYQNAYRAMPNPLSPFDFMQNIRTSTEEKPGNGKRSTTAERTVESRRPETKQSEPEDVAELSLRIDIEVLQFRRESTSRQSVAECDRNR